MQIPKIDKSVEAIFLFDAKTAEEISDCELVCRDRLPEGSQHSFDQFNRILLEMAAAAKAEQRVVVITINLAPIDVAYRLAKKAGL